MVLNISEESPFTKNNCFSTKNKPPSPNTANPDTPKPITDPPVKDTFNACAKLVLAA